ncbi:MAG TPA: hypothetical protein VGI39_33630 [Polyangiaceae bacterium]|jgi:hypothetical protein
MAKNKTMTAACWLSIAALPALVACGAPPDGHEGEGQGEPTATETATAPGAQAKQDLAAPTTPEKLKNEYCIYCGGVVVEPTNPTIVPGDPGTIVVVPIIPIIAPPVQAPIYAVH